MRITHFLPNQGIQTAYNEAGPETGTPLILVHGFTGSKLDFTDELDQFADPQRVIAYDQRGHGESSNLGPYTLEQMAADLIGLLDQLQIKQCDLLGHSMGGMVALRAVLQSPQRFCSLVLMDTSAEPVKLFGYLARKKLSRVIEKHGCEALLESMRSLPASPAAQRGIDQLGADEHWQRIHTKLCQMDPKAFQDLSARLAAGKSLVPRLGEILCPTTIIVGEHDTPFRAPSDALTSGIPNASLEIIPGAGHSPQYENTSAWRTVLRSHLASL